MSPRSTTCGDGWTRPGTRASSRAASATSTRRTSRTSSTTSPPTSTCSGRASRRSATTSSSRPTIAIDDRPGRVGDRRPPGVLDTLQPHARDEGPRPSRGQPRHVREARPGACTGRSRWPRSTLDSRSSAGSSTSTSRRSRRTPKGAMCERIHAAHEDGTDGRRHQRRRLDPLQLRDPGRPRDPVGADRRGAHVERPRPGGVPRDLRVLGHRDRPDRRVRRRQLSARPARGRVLSRAARVAPARRGSRSCPGRTALARRRAAHRRARTRRSRSDPGRTDPSSTRATVVGEIPRVVVGQRSLEGELAAHEGLGRELERPTIQAELEDRAADLRLARAPARRPVACRRCPRRGRSAGPRRVCSSATAPSPTANAVRSGLTSLTTTSAPWRCSARHISDPWAPTPTTSTDAGTGARSRRSAVSTTVIGSTQTRSSADPVGDSPRVLRRHDDLLGDRAGSVHAHRLAVRAGRRPSPTHRARTAADDVRLDDDDLAEPRRGHRPTDRLDGPEGLVAHDPRIRRRRPTRRGRRSGRIRTGRPRRRRSAPRPGPASAVGTSSTTIRPGSTSSAAFTGDGSSSRRGFADEHLLQVCLRRSPGPKHREDPIRDASPCASAEPREPATPAA